MAEEYTLPNLNSFRFLQTGFMVQHMICLDTYSCALENNAFSMVLDVAFLKYQSGKVGFPVSVLDGGDGSGFPFGL